MLPAKPAAASCRRRRPFDEHRRQLARFQHLADDVAAADELALHVKLRDGRPVGERLDPVAHAHVLQDVDVLVVDAEGAKDVVDLGREPALRHVLVALHEQDDVVRRDRLADPVLHVLLRVAHVGPLEYVAIGGHHPALLGGNVWIGAGMSTSCARRLPRGEPAAGRRRCEIREPRWLAPRHGARRPCGRPGPRRPSGAAGRVSCP